MVWGYVSSMSCFYVWKKVDIILPTHVHVFGGGMGYVWQRHSAAWNGALASHRSDYQIPSFTQHMIDLYNTIIDPYKHMIDHTKT